MCPDCRPHFVLLPSSGMGHLTPFLRLAASLAAHNVQVTLITAHPTVSLAESDTLKQFCFAFPQVAHRKMSIPPIGDAISFDDPFTLHYEAIRRSSHTLSPLLSSLSPPLSAVVTDMSLTSVVIPITKELNLSNYIFFTSSAKMLAIYAIYHKIAADIAGEGDVFLAPSLESIPKSWLPPPLLSQGHNLLKTHFIENGESFLQSNGILTNTFEDLEKDSLAALNTGLVVNQLPPVIAIGLLSPCAFEGGEVATWLNDQSARSVLYVSFGSRAAISRKQMRELGNGLVSSGCKFLWVVKARNVDREDREELEEMVGKEILEKVNEKGLMLKTWMNQDQNADQKINADLAERNAVAIWEKNWGWGGKESVGEEEIAPKIRELMENEMLRNKAEEIRDKARTALRHGGSSKNNLIGLIESLRQKHRFR
ncbi:hypothetical protein Cgig2_013442 [Carnegiea gigantea]|uniref:Uncharacterized protein n=1 Tax=Carnegiea gigantea TaxID=171969 RepID=A0A9Q1K7L0_9CARY|nr:hypothetical protein Cgig2_013442 [Carnegiea gigantea]